MGGLARILSESDHDISGSDVAFYPPMSDQLNDLGINLTHGYAAKDLPGADLYIIGMLFLEAMKVLNIFLKRNLILPLGLRCLAMSSKIKMS